MKIVIAGFQFPDDVRRAVLDSGFKPTEVICGQEANGIIQYAQEERLPVSPHMADEMQFGAYAYPMRNMAMAQAGDAAVIKPSESHLAACFKKKGAPVFVAEYVVPPPLPDTGRIFEPQPKKVAAPIKIEVIEPAKKTKKTRKRRVVKRKPKPAKEATPAIQQDIPGYV